MIEFPDPRQCTPEGLVAYGGSWTADTLRAAYRKGIFPWPQLDLPILWFSPDPRGVLDFKDFHIPTSFQKQMRKQNFRVTRNTAFCEVMKRCQQQNRKGQSGTWILDEMIPIYEELFHFGEALSWEIWDADELVGGLYGVFLDGHFSGESMFHIRSGASKWALVHCVRDLKAAGVTWMDTQMVTSVLALFGARELSREEFLARLKV